MKRLALIAVVIAVAAVAARAENMWPAPWEGEPAYDMYAQTFQMWDFPWLLQGIPYEPPPEPPELPSDWGNLFGMPFIDWPQGEVVGKDNLGNPVTVTATTEVQWVDYWPPGSTPGCPGIPNTPTVHIGSSDPSVTVPVKIFIPNSKDDNLYKDIFWQMTSDKSATPQGDPPSTEPPGTSRPSDHPQSQHGGGNWYTYSGLNRISPNPDGETLTFYLANSTNIEEIVIKTICAPEPATLGLLAAGGLMTLVRRRR